MLVGGDLKPEETSFFFFNMVLVSIVSSQFIPSVRVVQ